MDGLEILESLRTLGITVTAVEPDRLRLEPASKIPAEMVTRIREAKPGILEALRNRRATCSPDCYEIEPGVLIHRPHAGCTTMKPEVSGSQHKVPETCWHCHGNKICACIACGQPGPSRCVACKGRGKVWRWVQ